VSSSRHVPAVVPQAGPVTERLRVREIDDDDEGRRLVRIVRRGSGSVVTWRRAQMVLLPAQGMDAAGIAKVAFTIPSAPGTRAGCGNVNLGGRLVARVAGGLPCLYPLKPDAFLAQQRAQPAAPPRPAVLSAYRLTRRAPTDAAGRRACRCSSAQPH
jgi:hypothetical protein